MHAATDPKPELTESLAEIKTPAMLFDVNAMERNLADLPPTHEGKTTI